MPFETEAALVQALVRHIRAAFPEEEVKLQLEIDAGVGIADVILFQQQQHVEEHIALLGSLPVRLAPLLDPLVSGAFASTTLLGKALGRPPSAAARVVKNLAQRGVLEAATSGVSADKIPFTNLIAIEAKLKDWGRALVQAFRNKQFAEESWVLIDHAHARSALANVSRFVRSGVGLASLDSSDNLFIHVVSERREPFSRTHQWQCQAALAHRLLKQSSAEHASND